MRRVLFLLLLSLSVAACRGNVEVEKVLKLTDVHSGWYDAGIQPDGKNKLVPSISIKLQNVSDESIASVQVNAVFRRVGEDTEWGDHYVRAIGRDGLPPGATTNPIVLRSTFGYTGTQPRIRMLENKDFVDAKVEIFGKHGSRPMVRIGEYQIDRQLLTQ